MASTQTVAPALLSERSSVYHQDDAGCETTRGRGTTLTTTVRDMRPYTTWDGCITHSSKTLRKTRTSAVQVAAATTRHCQLKKHENTVPICNLAMSFMRVSWTTANVGQTFKGQGRILFKQDFSITADGASPIGRDLSTFRSECADSLR